MAAKPNSTEKRIQMGEYFDKEKFTGKTDRGPASPPKQPIPPPHRPQPDQESNAWWYSWPAIIILFSLGIWPVALGLLFLNLFGDKKRKSSGTSAQAAESVVERAMRRAEERADGAASKTDEAIRRAAKQVERSVSRAAKQVESSAHSAPPRPTKKKKEKAKPAGTLLRTSGICLLAIGSIIGLDFMAELLNDGYVDFDNFFASLGFLFSGGLMFSRGLYLNHMNRRSQRYILAIGIADAMPLDVIAKRVNRKPAQAARELQKLIDKGYLGEDAYIDHERGYFLRFGAAMEFQRKPEPVQETPPPPPPA